MQKRAIISLILGIALAAFAIGVFAIGSATSIVWGTILALVSFALLVQGVAQLWNTKMN